MPRTLSEAEFNAVKAKVLASAPDKLSEADFTRWVGPAMAQALGEAENTPEGVNLSPEGSATERGVSGAWKNLNPLTAIEGLYGAARHPLDTAGAILDANLRELKKANEDRKAGRYSEMVGHGGAGLIPLIGPAAAAAGERIASGDVAGGVGEATGLLAPFAASSVARGGAAAARTAVTGARAVGGAGALDTLAEMADRASTNRMVDVAGPKVGPNKLRLNNQLAKVSPDLARADDLSALSRQGLQHKVEAKLADATATLDDAADARLNAKTFPTKPILDELKAKRAALTSEAVQGSVYKPKMTSGVILQPGEGQIVGKPAAVREPIGEDVIPAPNRARVAPIDQAIAEVKKLGPVARYESLRRIRQAYDAPAKAVYSPSMTADYLAKRGESLGAADVTGVLRDHLATMDPATAAANADYSLYKTANDVLKATEETERARPRVLRGIVARTGGAMVGAESGGVLGAGAGVLLGAMVERAAELAPTTKIVVARQLAKAADFLRGGQAQQAQAAIKKAQTVIQMAKKTAVRTAVPMGRALETTPLPMAAGNQQDSPATIGQR